MFPHKQANEIEGTRDIHGSHGNCKSVATLLVIDSSVLYNRTAQVNVQI